MFQVVGGLLLPSALSLSLAYTLFRIRFTSSLSPDGARPGTSTQDVLHTWKLCDLKIYLFKRSREFWSVHALRAVAGDVPALVRQMAIYG